MRKSAENIVGWVIGIAMLIILAFYVYVMATTGGPKAIIQRTKENIARNVQVQLKLEKAGYEEICSKNTEKRECIWFHPKDNGLPLFQVRDGEAFEVVVKDGKIFRRGK